VRESFSMITINQWVGVSGLRLLVGIRYHYLSGSTVSVSEVTKPYDTSIKNIRGINSLKYKDVPRNS
jgi:hypothetical protein